MHSTVRFDSNVGEPQDEGAAATITKVTSWPWRRRRATLCSRQPGLPWSSSCLFLLGTLLLAELPVLDLVLVDAHDLHPGVPATGPHGSVHGVDFH